MKEFVSNDNDEFDVHASLKGDENAFRRLVERYEDIVASRMRRFTRDPVELRELIQDVFVEVYLSLPGFKFKAPFTHWLSKIAVRTGYRFWKKKEKEKKRGQSLEDRHLAMLAAPDETEPHEAAEALQEIFGLLPPKDRLILTLFYFEDLNHKEICAATGWTGAVVKVRIHRARKKLRTLLENAGLGRESYE